MAERMVIKRLDDDDYLIHFNCDLRAPNEKVNFIRQNASGLPDNPEEIPILARLGKANAMLEMLLSGTYASRGELATALNVNTVTISRTLNFAFVAPEIIEGLMRGEIPASKVIALADKVNMMPFWADQHRFVGVA